MSNVRRIHIREQRALARNEACVKITLEEYVNMWQIIDEANRDAQGREDPRTVPDKWGP